MNRKFVLSKPLPALAAFAACAAGLMLIMALVACSVDSQSSENGNVEETQTQFSVNENGQTYGTILEAGCDGVMPELVEVEATNGLQGYAYWSEMNSDAAANTEIPVYEIDGKTQIGVLKIEPQ